MTTSDTPHISWAFPDNAPAPGQMKCVHCGATQQTGPGWDDFVRRHARCEPKPTNIVAAFDELRAAGGDGWDDIDDPLAFLGRKGEEAEREEWAKVEAKRKAKEQERNGN